MPLEGLSLVYCTRIKELSALKDLPLKELYLNSCISIENLAPLRGMKTLRRLSFPSTKAAIVGLTGVGRRVNELEEAGIV